MVLPHLSEKAGWQALGQDVHGTLRSSRHSTRSFLQKEVSSAADACARPIIRCPTAAVSSSHRCSTGRNGRAGRVRSESTTLHPADNQSAHTLCSRIGYRIRTAVFAGRCPKGGLLTKSDMATPSCSEDDRDFKTRDRKLTCKFEHQVPSHFVALTSISRLQRNQVLPLFLENLAPVALRKCRICMQQNSNCLHSQGLLAFQNSSAFPFPIQNSSSLLPLPPLTLISK